MTRKVLLVQYPLGVDLTKDDYKRIIKEQPHFICFPEYFFISRNHPNVTDNAQFSQFYKDKIRTYSSDFNCIIIGGTMITEEEGLFYNTCFVYNQGVEIGHYKKINLFQSEKGLLSQGKDYFTFQNDGIKLGVLICADVFLKEAFAELKFQGVQVIFIPTLSPYKNETVQDKYQRDKKIYLSASRQSHSCLVKVCSVGTLFGKKAQGRSLVASPDRIEIRVEPCDEQKQQLLFVDLNFY